VFVCEGSAGAGFEVLLELGGLGSGLEGEVGLELPGAVIGGAGDSSFVVLLETGFEVGG
jgi:hypothetical protein